MKKLTVAQAKKTLERLMLRIGPGYHPDNSAKDYVNIHSNVLAIPDVAERAAFDLSQEMVWDTLGEKIYGVGLKLQDKLWPMGTYNAQNK